MSEFFIHFPWNKDCLPSHSVATAVVATVANPLLSWAEGRLLLTLKTSKVLQVLPALIFLISVTASEFAPLHSEKQSPLPVNSRTVPSLPSPELLILCVSKIEDFSQFSVMPFLFTNLMCHIYHDGGSTNSWKNLSVIYFSFALSPPQSLTPAHSLLNPFLSCVSGKAREFTWEIER